jgi:hypothetical protein
MPTPTSTRTAERVEASADALSAALLHQEEVTFTRVDTQFAVHLPGISLKTLSGVRNSRAERARIRAAHAAAVSACRPHVENLARFSARAAAGAITTELGLLEATMAPDRRGVLDRMGPLDLDPVVTAALASYDKSLADVAGRFSARLTHALGQADDLDDLRVRLFRVDRRPRGCWWDVADLIRGRARWVSIAVANSTRLGGMRAFNAAADA